MRKVRPKNVFFILKWLFIRGKVLQSCISDPVWSDVVRMVVKSNLGRKILFSKKFKSSKRDYGFFSNKTPSKRPLPNMSLILGRNRGKIGRKMSNFCLFGIGSKSSKASETDYRRTKSFPWYRGYWERFNWLFKQNTFMPWSTFQHFKNYR